VVWQRQHGRRGTRRAIGYVVALSMVLIAAQIAAGWSAVAAWRDRAEVVQASRLSAALRTFRPSERAGLAKPASAADLASDRGVRTNPPRCSSLTLLSRRMPLDGESWTGINGSPAQPVNILTVRFSDAAAARRELAAKQAALLTCGSVGLIFPPFDKPEERFEVYGRRLPFPGEERVGYSLVGNGRRYEFYVRRYANTLTWSYGADESAAQVRQEVVDALIGRLREMASE
jgi:hypothetical protein